jgi:RNA recognition motif-containing protein
LDGRELKVRIAYPPSQPEPQDNKSIFVGNLSFTSTEETIKKFFQGCGKILGFNMPVNYEGQPKGFAFIEFEAEEGAKKALALNEKELDKRAISVGIAKGRRQGGFGRGRGRFRGGGFRGGFRGSFGRRRFRSEYGGRRFFRRFRGEGHYDDE